MDRKSPFTIHGQIKESRANKKQSRQLVTLKIARFNPLHHILKAMLHEAIFLATCNATMANKKLFKLQRGCYTQATCLATLRKVEGRSTFLATRNATIAVAKWGVTRKFFLATSNATFVGLQVARKIASCNMALLFPRQHDSEAVRKLPLTRGLR